MGKRGRRLKPGKREPNGRLSPDVRALPSPGNLTASVRRRRQFDDDELHWYALDVMRQKEYVAGLILNRMGCVTFIPTETRFRKKNRYAKSKIEIAYPALPGVVFAGFPAPPHWYRIRAVHLINGVLSVDGLPRRIDTASPEWIKYRSRQLDGSLIIERQKVMYRGEEVERSAALVQIQGRGVLRSALSISVRASADRPIVIPVKGERGRILRTLFAADPVDALRVA